MILIDQNGKTIDVPVLQGEIEETGPAWVGWRAPEGYLIVTVDGSGHVRRETPADYADTTVPPWGSPMDAIDDTGCALLCGLLQGIPVGRLAVLVGELLSTFARMFVAHFPRERFLLPVEIVVDWLRMNGSRALSEATDETRTALAEWLVDRDLARAG